MAAKACKFFAENGYPVMELEGGFDAWQKHSLPIGR
jgi:rhodanese-related sulfurtransferase